MKGKYFRKSNEAGLNNTYFFILKECEALLILFLK